MDFLAQADRRPAPWLALLALLLLVQIDPWWRPGNDACAYLSIARSVARGGPVERLGSRQIFFAPGYPLLISPAFLIGDRPFRIIQTLHWLLAVALLLGVHRWARRSLPGGALAVTWLVIVNASFWMHYRRTLSETAFMAVLVWTGEALQAATLPGPAARRLGLTLLGALLAAALSAIRQAGIFLTAGFAVAMGLEAWRGRVGWPRAVLQSLAVGLPAAAVVLSLVLLDQRHAPESPGASTYLDHFVDPGLGLAERVSDGIRQRASDVGRLLVPGMVKAQSRQPTWLDPNLIVYLPVAAAAALGWWRFARRAGDVWAWSLPFYLGFHVFWPFGQATRFVLPVLPLLWAAVWCLLERAPRRRQALLPLLAVAHLGVSAGFWVAERKEARELNALWPALETLAAPVRESGLEAAAVDLKDDRRFLLQFLIDRPLPNQESVSSVPGTARWVFAPERMLPPPGFSPRRRSGGLQLLFREGN